MLIPANCVLGMLARNQNNNHSHVILLFTVKNVKLTDSVVIVLWDPLFKWMILNLLMNLYQHCHNLDQTLFDQILEIDNPDYVVDVEKSELCNNICEIGCF